MCTVGSEYLSLRDLLIGVKSPEKIIPVLKLFFNSHELFPSHPEIPKEVRQHYPINILHIEGGTSSGKTSFASAYGLFCVLQSGLNGLPHFPIFSDEPPPVTLPWIIAKFFGVEDKGLPTFRELCKGGLDNPYMQLFAFMMDRSRLHCEFKQLQLSFADNSINPHNLPVKNNGFEANAELYAALNTELIQGKINPTLSEVKIPLEIIVGRSFMSSMVYQAFIMSVQGNFPIQDAMKTIWDAHKILISRNLLIKPNNLFLVIPKGVRPIKPDAIASIDIGKSYLDDRGERDIYEYLFSENGAEKELWLYLEALKVLRSDPEAPQVFVLINDTTGATNTIGDLVAIANALNNGYLRGDSEYDLATVVRIFQTVYQNERLKKLLGGGTNYRLSSNNPSDLLAMHPELRDLGNGIFVHQQDYFL